MAPPAFADYWASMNGLVRQLAARRPQVGRLPMGGAFPMIGLVGQLAARSPQVALSGRLPLNSQLGSH